MTQRIAVAIICKTPMAGKSKTRLSPPLMPEECAAISACFIQDLARTIAGLDATRAQPFAVYTPVGTEPALTALLPPVFRLMPQGEGDLGDRLHRGVIDLLEDGHAGAILINSDSPTLPARLLAAAVAALDGRDRMVICPALDGGYTFIGLSRPHRQLFEDMEWSVSTVFERTMERAREIGLDTLVLEPWYDVDDAESYAMLEAELATSDQIAPMTRGFVTQRAQP